MSAVSLSRPVSVLMSLALSAVLALPLFSQAAGFAA